MHSFFYLASIKQSELWSELHPEDDDFLEDSDLYDLYDNDDYDFGVGSKSFDQIIDDERLEQELYSRACAEALIYLLDSGLEFDVNEKDVDSDYTILMTIVQIGRLDLVRTLVQLGADPNARHGSGFALKYAAEDGWPEIFAYLAPITAPELRSIAEPLLHEGILRRQKIESKSVGKTKKPI